MALSSGFLGALGAALPPDGLLTDAADLRTYECDGLTGRRVLPAAVCLPERTGQVQAAVRACHEHGIPFVARGAGTGLSGGALPVAEGIVISLARMNSVLDVDLDSQRIVVQPGVTNLEVTEAVAAEGFYYAPDPSSQQVCTIGGNVAENSGGAHCLKYGFTVNHVTGLVVVLPDGELVELGGKGLDTPGPDVLGVFIGSEGTIGIATEVTLRLTPRPEVVVTQLAAFDSTDEAGAAVSGIVAARILPAAVEMMDRLTIEAVEQAVHCNYPDAGAILIVELDGVAAQVDEDLAALDRICREHGAWEIRTAADADERALLWKGRKSAFAAMGRVARNYYVQDGVVPRTKLLEVLRRIAELEREHGLRVGNVFHAGDGNLHPLVLYDEHVPGEAERAETLAEAILVACIDAGGTLTGEHGVGTDKAEAILVACIDAGGTLTGEHGVGTDKACSMPLLFGRDDLEAMQRLRRAFDPAGLANPGKVFPTPRLCGEVPGPYRQHPLEKAGLADRL